MKRIVILSGPQAAGKSTSLNKLHGFLTHLYPCFTDHKEIAPIILQEARQIVVHKYHTKGAIFLTPEQEKEMIAIDFIRMEEILRELDDTLLYFDECNIFTLAHAKAHGVDLIDEYLPRYLEILNKLHATVIFLDIHPNISWERRKDAYKSRLHRFPEKERDGLFERYHQYLNTLHPALNDLYEKIDLPKTRINADDKHENVMQKITKFLFTKNII